jgi:hypothetical protein
LLLRKQGKILRNVKIKKELIDNVPQNSELATHDGVIYFPKEMMPEENENLLGTFHEDINGNRI